MNHNTIDTKETVSENTTQTDANAANIKRIKKEDKKAIIPFLLLCLAGGLVGYFAADIILSARDSLKGDELLQNFHNMQISFRSISGYASLIISVVLCLAGFILLIHCKKYHKKNNSNNEMVLYKLEMWLSIILILTTAATILAWLLYGLGFYGFNFSFDSKSDLLPLIFCLGGFLVMSVCTTILQQKVVNFEKELNPEKRGSVYDVKFQKKWMDSCDEAEQFFIYKCCYKSYMGTQAVCMILEIILVLVGMALPIGIVPIICVTIIWATSSFIYMVAAMKLTKPPVFEEE